MHSSLFTLGHAFEKKAIFISSEMNFLNRINETFILLSSYFLISFTDLQDDIDLRNKIGKFFVYLILAIINFNIITLITYVAFRFCKKCRM